ncbi:M23 family peptidase [Pseudoflavonifractor sp. AF19-9AC]|uniref:M23 family metallopeptidase n=1 Tax=Pseudoflavonifractor sp. AF19-9AC TaxID=2292244 RepID=UPI000E532CF5|nr:M23 family metallopeptidase [Pseudoflavonifractor sp. AF19-9AC]RHR08959.1 M23 family peptidase [Pseudoflavonifractor sp. AF19-9AC]
MYNDTARTHQVNTYPRRSGAGDSKKRTTAQDRLRLLQLFICLILFLAVFLGKGIFPGKLLEIRDDLLAMITSNTDFRAAFSVVGETDSEESILSRLEDFCVAVFGAEDGGASNSVQSKPELASFLSKESSFPIRTADEQAITDHLLAQNAWKLPISSNQSTTEETVPPEAESTDLTEELEAVPAAGTLILKSDYDGDPLPEHYTMDQLSLGTLETMTPVLGYINSEYGYRDHPINGTYQFHGGVDISGQTGDPIQAFASGTVEYVGKDDSYGLYLQLDHGNGVKSFYAHCSEVCVTKGQSVTIGDTIAKIGSTGMSTGPHLHLELKFNKMHLNPIYYIEYMTDQ